MPPTPSRAPKTLRDVATAARTNHKPRSTSPVWAGPESDAPNGGVTQSLLSRFLCCRERFRVLVIEGLQPVDHFNHKLEFGSLWHICEEAAASEVRHFKGELIGIDTTAWEDDLTAYGKTLAQRYPMDREQIDHWMQVVKVTFPLYVQHWASHKHVQTRRSLLQEKPFSVPYRLPSQRTVILRGKWDGVDLVSEQDRGHRPGAKWIELFETKTKGQIVEEQLRRQLTFDLQTMLYLVALQEYQHGPSLFGHEILSPDGAKVCKIPIRGVYYNVVRRPLSGGKGTIVRHKATEGAKCPKCKGTGTWVPKGEFSPHPGCPKCGGRGRIGGKPEESRDDYYQRVATTIKDNPGDYFQRWQVLVSPRDIETFRHQFLDPILEQMCDWWYWVRQESLDPFKPGIPSGLARGEVHQRYGVHWRHPFGVYNVMDEGGASDLDEYLATGSLAGLTRTTNLFPELG